MPPALNLALSLNFPVDQLKGETWHWGLIARWCRNGLLSPFFVAQVLLIIGFSEAHADGQLADPLARLLNNLPATAAVCRDLALGVYLLHVPILQLAKAGPMHEVLQWWPASAGVEASPVPRLHGFPRALYVLGVLGVIMLSAAALVYGVQKPINRLTKKLNL